MDAIAVVAPLIGVVLGSALSGMGEFIKERRERKRKVAIALADLLEIRHCIVAVDAILVELHERAGMPKEITPALRNFLDSNLPSNDGLDERYNNAVTQLAGYDPVLAFSLRSKNTLSPFLFSLRNLALQSGADPKEFEVIESQLRVVVTPTLNSAVVELACYHSWFTKRRVQRMVGKAAELPPEMTQLLDQIKAGASLPGTSVT